MWTLSFTQSFQKAFRTIDPSARKQLKAFIAQHADGIESPSSLTNFSLLTNHPNFGRFRFGKYRAGVFLDY